MVKQRIEHLLLCCLALLSATACNKEHRNFLESRNLMDPVALDKYVVFIDKADHNAYLLDVLSKELESRAQAIELPRNPALIEKRNQAEELLVLCAGQKEDVDQDYKPPELAVLKGGKVTYKYKLTQPFNALVQSEDGETALLYFDESKTDSANSNMSRRNEVAIVDLTKPPKQGDLSKAPETGENPWRRQLDSEDGSAPKAIVLSQKMSVVGKERRLALAIFKAQVSIMDLNHLDRKEIKIPQTDIAADSAIFYQGEKETADENGNIAVEKTATIFLRSSSTDDIYILDLTTPPSVKANDFWPSIETKKAGGRSSDMALYEEEAQGSSGDKIRLPRLLVVSEVGSEAAIIEPETSNETHVPLGFSPDRVLLYKAAAPFDPIVAPRALLYREGGGSKTIGFLDLVQVQERMGQNLERKDLAADFEQLIPLRLSEKDNLAALVRKQSGISLLNLAERTADTIRTGAVSQVVLDPQKETIWLPSAESEPESESYQLGYIEVETRAADYVLLDAAIDKIVPVGSGNNKRLVVTHPSNVGYVTVLDAINPSRKTAVSLQGYFIADVLDLGE